MPPTELEIMTARVELLREAHEMANQALRTAYAVAEREGNNTNWKGHRAQLMASLEASHAALDALRAYPAPQAETKGDAS